MEEGRRVLVAERVRFRVKTFAAERTRVRGAERFREERRPAVERPLVLTGAVDRVSSVTSRLHLPAGLRAARPGDARDLAYLINEAGEGLALYFWTKSAQGGDPWQHGTERARRTSGDFSYKNAHVLEAEDSVVGMLLGFVIQAAPIDFDELPEIIRPLVRLEQQAAGSFYINALALRPEYRGRGMGTRLIALAHALALLAECPEVSLQNFTINSRARALYQRLGFSERARLAMPRSLNPALPDLGESILHAMPASAELAAPFLR